MGTISRQDRASMKDDTEAEIGAPFAAASAHGPVASASIGWRAGAAGRPAVSARAAAAAAQARPPHALIIVENLPVPFDRRVWQEAEALRDAGWRVSVICPLGKGHDALHEVLDGVEIHRHPLPQASGGRLSYLREYAHALAAQLRLSARVHAAAPVDVIHACNPPDLIFLVAAWRRLLSGTRFVFDHHDLCPELFETKFARPGRLHRVFLTALRLCERATFALADATIATNETFKRLAVSRGGMDPDEVWVVKSYPRPERFRRVEPDPARIKPGRSLVGYVGIMAEQDGVDLLVRAMAVLRDRGRDDIACVIVGDGPALAWLRNLSRNLGVDDRVDFTGYLAGDPLLATLSAVDIGVIPDPPDAFNSKLSMNKVFEYMMLGLPFVQFDLAQARSESRKAALVASEGTPESLADGIAELADDPQRRAEMGAWGREVAAREFRWDREASKLIEAHGHALAKRSRRLREA
jgi:glycosyltransferase involved in cell wall biosynthesis